MRLVILKGLSIGHMLLLSLRTRRSEMDCRNETAVRTIRFRDEGECCFKPGDAAHREDRVEGFQRPALEAPSTTLVHRPCTEVLIGH